MSKNIRELEVIDFKKKGNAVRLFLGKNGPQTGDDWDDTPYEHNAEEVSPEYIEGAVDLYFPVDNDVREPADDCINSSYCKDDFKFKKSWCIWVTESMWGSECHLDPVAIFFGDTLKEVEENLKGYDVIVVDRSKQYDKV